MKAVGITLHSVCNYGTQLQLFATQEKLKEYYDEVEFINYKRVDTYGRKFLYTFTKGSFLKTIIILPTLIYWKKIFGEFQKKYINLSKERYLSEQDLQFYNEDDADVYFTGSDQVWNTGWNNGIISPYYLSFISNHKFKFAFAASFGVQRISCEDIEKSIGLIQQYNYISVRENSGKQILKNQYNYSDAVQILDPTLLFDGTFWRKYEGKSLIKKDYILIYNLQKSKEFDRYASEISKRTGIKLYRFCTRFDQIIRNGKSIVIPSIFDFVTLIDNAKLVITDSFHATAFAMNLNTNPICLYPEKYSGRISEFLELLDASDRHPQNFEDFSVLEKNVDFSKVNCILEKKRDEASTFLEKVVKESKENR